MAFVLFISYLFTLVCLIVSSSASFDSTIQPTITNKISCERCFVAIKPDAIQRNLIGDIIQRFERKGLRLCAIKLVLPNTETVQQQYFDLKEASFFQDILKFFCSGPIMATVWEGENAVAIARKLIGKTHPEDAEPGSIRGDYCIGKGRNLVHASDSVLSAKREISIWFQPNEVLSYSKTIESWMYPN